MTQIMICIPDNPYTSKRHKQGMHWKHSNVHEVGEQEDGWPSGDIITNECKNCGVRWKEELPQ